MKIVIVNGSVRTGRYSIHVSVYLKEILAEMEGVDVEFLDIKEFDFPVMEERMRFLDSVPDNMQDFSKALFEADGIILVSPEYNGSYSGALKNTLDYFKAEYERKPMALVTVSGGRMGGANAMHHLQAWAIHVKGIVSPYKLYVDYVDKKFDKNGSLLTKDFERPVKSFLDKFLWLTEAVRNHIGK